MNSLIGLGRQSGVVIHPNGEVIICNWWKNNIVGVPRVSDGKLVGLGETFGVTDNFDEEPPVVDIASFLPKNAVIVYDEDNRYDSLAGYAGNICEITVRGTDETAIVIFPDYWE